MVCTMKWKKKRRKDNKNIYLKWFYTSLTKHYNPNQAYIFYIFHFVARFLFVFLRILSSHLYSDLIGSEIKGIPFELSYSFFNVRSKQWGAVPHLQIYVATNNSLLGKVFHSALKATQWIQDLKKNLQIS
jgi:hypothetical protein